MGNHANHNCATMSVAGRAPGITDTVRHIYVHIPFCARICPYCAFYKELLDRSQLARFCQAVVGEIAEYGGNLSPSTIYFGGGTPTALGIPQLELLLNGFREHIDTSEVIEWTVEANPGSVSRRKADFLKQFGVNRISLGVQSWDDALLKVLGREHNAQQAAESIQILRTAGFTNLNVDLMFGLPGQTIGQWRTSLEKTIALEPEHISTYCLTYEEDTEFFARHMRGEFRQDSDADAEFLDLAMWMLQSAGYEHYEISNYARPNFASLHNQAYWAGKDYLGIGPSAFSTAGMRRWQNVCDYHEYITRIFDGRSPITSSEDLTSSTKRAERIALSLRTRDGVPSNLLMTKPKELEEFLRLGLIHQCNGNFVLTPAGKALADTVAETFI
jgi:oxygen-independent coproporphyrinogen III oxidase